MQSTSIDPIKDRGITSHYLLKEDGGTRWELQLTTSHNAIRKEYIASVAGFVCGGGISHTMFTFDPETAVNRNLDRLPAPRYSAKQLIAAADQHRATFHDLYESETIQRIISNTERMTL